MNHLKPKFVKVRCDNVTRTFFNTKFEHIEANGYSEEDLSYKGELVVPANDFMKLFRYTIEKER